MSLSTDQESSRAAELWGGAKSDFMHRTKILAKPPIGRPRRSVKSLQNLSWVG
jgi:hypothetical protein